MSELISGKEAKLAWAEGAIVQVAIGPDRFRTLVSSDDLGIFDRGNYFRLKPRTITINGIEMPAPFKPTEDCLAFIIDGGKTDGWRAYGYEVDGDATSQFLGLWRTEDEIKQVVSALRSVFKGGV